MPQEDIVELIIFEEQPKQPDRHHRHSLVEHEVGKPQQPLFKRHFDFSYDHGDGVLSIVPSLAYVADFLPG